MISAIAATSAWVRRFCGAVQADERGRAQASPADGDATARARALAELAATYQHWTIVAGDVRGWWAMSTDAYTPIGCESTLQAGTSEELAEQLAAQERLRRRRTR